MIHFSFTKIVVGDLEACGAFYAEVFGLREQYRLRSEIGGRAIDEVLFEARVGFLADPEGRLIEVVQRLEA